LVAHDAIERRIFYPACRKKPGLLDVLGESLLEHGLVEFALYRASLSQGRDDFPYALTVLREVVEHHVEEEQDELFSEVTSAFEDEELEELGRPMEREFRNARANDYRAPLLANLRQVLAGVLEPDATDAESRDEVFLRLTRPTA